MNPVRLLAAIPVACLAACATPTATPPGPGGLVPDTLFLTWSDDPSTTMTIQWLERGAVRPLAEGQSDEATTPIQRLDAAAIDGDDADWDQAGYAARLLANAAGEAPAPADHAAILRLAHDDRGLLVLLEITDDEIRESPRDHQLWHGDSVELFFSQADGSRPWQFVVAPGLDPEHPALRSFVVDRRGDEALPPPAAEAAARRTESGYRIEVRLPWEASGIDPATATVGEAAARLQVYCNDRDTDGVRTRLVWFPSEDTHFHAHSSRALSLGGGAAAPTGIAERARGQLQRSGEDRRVAFLAEHALAGREVALVAGGREIARATLEADGHVARATADIPTPDQRTRWGALSVVADGQSLGPVHERDDAWTETPAPIRVVCGPEPQRGSSARPRSVRTQVHPFGESAYFVHRARLTGLAPDTTYVFQVEATGEQFRFRTAPATLEPGKPIVFAEGGDIGVNPDRVIPLHEMAASWDPLFGLVGGDLAYSDGRNVHIEVRFLQQWHAHMRTADNRLIPLVPALGNHEVNGSFAQTRDKAPYFFSLFDDLFPEESHATLDFGDYLSLLLLDTHHVTEIIGPQTRWLGEALEERLGPPDRPRENPPHVFPVYHVPAYPSHRAYDGVHSTRVREHWVPLFEKYGVRVALEHHDHAYKRTHPLLGDQPTEDPRGVVYLGDGCWGIGARDVHPERAYLAKTLSTLHVFKVTLEPDGARFEAFDEKRNKLDEHRYSR